MRLSRQGTVELHFSVERVPDYGFRYVTGTCGMTELPSVLSKYNSD